MADHDDDDEAQLELEAFVERGGRLQLVSNLRTDRVERVAYKQPGAEDWQELSLEDGPAGHVFRETATNLVTGLITRELPGIEPPTDLDAVLDTVTGIISPRKIAGKLASAAAQALAHHLGLSLIAHAVGEITEQIVTSLPFPENAIDKALNTATISTVAYDLHADQLTATVEDFVVEEIPEIASDPTIPEWIVQKQKPRPALELEPSSELEGLLRLRRAAESPEISRGHPVLEIEEPEIELRANASPPMLRHILARSSRDSGGLPKPGQQLPAHAPRRPEDLPERLHPGAGPRPNRLPRPGDF
jgi:hypothetical protein